jgi:ComF family protein
MAAQIAAQAPPGWLEAHGPAAEPDVVARPPQPAFGLVPVPLHPARRRRRGFNQAEWLAAAVGARVGLAVSDCLERAGPRGTQVGRDRAQRLSGISGSIKLATERAPPRQRAVLVDDVVTTGATLAACAAVLRHHGTAEVVAIAYARTPGR